MTGQVAVTHYGQAGAGFLTYSLCTAGVTMFLASFSNRSQLSTSIWQWVCPKAASETFNLSFTFPRGWSQAISEGSLELLLSLRVRIPRSKANWLCEVDGSVQDQASWEDTCMTGATYID